MATVEVAIEDTHRRFADAINRHDANAVAAVHAPDAEIYIMTPEGHKGRDAIRKQNEAFFKAFPDLTLRTLNIVSKGDSAAAELVLTGTHKGPLELPTGTLAPTNRQVTMKGATFFRVNREGLIAEARGYFDSASLLQQLGVKP
jgi:steroid delta-isomerase-like uncharacterized protein